MFLGGKTETNKETVQFLVQLNKFLSMIFK